ncbi:hypothetical protein ACGFZJ_41525 [Streptomyces sp. NPDC048253]|uniref:hypothetical protein n=1 Tax=Streptomyces sp. NPDC048253 TaxID=3365524 RepID=UPI00371AB278
MTTIFIRARSSAVNAEGPDTIGAGAFGQDKQKTPHEAGLMYGQVSARPQPTVAAQRATCCFPPLHPAYPQVSELALQPAAAQVS